MNVIWLISGMLLFVVALTDHFILKILVIEDIYKKNLVSIGLATTIGVHFTNFLFWRLHLDRFSMDFYTVSGHAFVFLFLLLAFLKIITYLLIHYLPSIRALNRSFSYRNFVHERLYPFVTDEFFPYERGVYCIVHHKGEIYSCIRRFYRDCSIQELEKIENELKKHFEIEYQMNAEYIKIHVETVDQKYHFRHRVFVDMCFDTTRSFDDPNVFRYFSRKLRKITDLSVDDEPVITTRDI